MGDTTNKPVGCCPRPYDSTAKFADALASLTRLYEDVRIKVESYGGDIEDLKEAIQKEVSDRIAADDKLKEDLLVVINEKIDAEKAERASEDAAIRKTLDDIAGSEIGGILEKLKAETSLRERGDAEEAQKRTAADENLGSRIDDEIASRTEESTGIKADVAAIKTQIEKLPGFYDRVDEVEDKAEMLQQSVTEEIAARAREVARLNGVDSALSERIKALEDSGTEAAIEAEKNARISADKELSEKIDAAKEECKDYTNSGCQRVHDKLTADIATEAFKREQADTGITIRVGQVHDDLISKLTTEANTRASEDAKLQNGISDISAKIAEEVSARKADTDGIKSTYATKAELTLESNARQLGDNACKGAIAELDGRITKEVSDRTAADNAINANVGRVQDALISKIANERQDRIDGDNALEARVKVLETKSPASESELSKEREERIAADNAEKEAREAADNTARGAINGLDNRLSDEVANRTMEDNKLWDAIRQGGGVVSVGSEDYSSFYVWASDVTVPAGKVSEMPESIRNTLKAVYGRKVDYVSVANPIAPNKTHTFTFRTVVDPTDLDMVVDWGDGTKTTLVEETWDDSNYKKYQPYEDVDEQDYTVTHTYAAAGRYLVKITGSRYFSYRHTEKNNLVAVPFAPQAHIASFISNISSMFKGSERLLVIDASYLYPFRNKGNMYGLFHSCKNLHTVLSLGMPINPSNMGSTYYGCSNLTVNDSSFGQMKGNDSIEYHYSGCVNLDADIGDIITEKFMSSSISVGSAFRDCKKLHGTVPAKYLWEDATIRWRMNVLNDASGSNKSGPFYGCSEEIRAQVPKSWGGTNASIVVRPYDPVVATSHDISVAYSNAAIKLASVSTEIKSLITGLALRVKELEESGSGGAPRDVIYMTANGVVYAVTAVNTDDDPTISIDVATGTISDEVIDRLYFYGSDGKRYVVKVAVVDGESTMSVERVSEIGDDASISTGIKLNCADDEAVYVMKVVKPVGEDAAIALMPFGA